jgi:hypothetical protein
MASPLIMRIHKARYHDVPVIINNRNRLSTLERLLDWLRRAEMREIYILDNASTYAPLLDFYRRMPYHMIRLSENVGYLALWETAVWQEFAHDYYIYTDSDVVPEDGCPGDLVHRLFEVLEQHPEIEKAGPGLRIDDIPDTNSLKAEILAMESRFWTKRASPGVYDAQIDTTFALYRPFARGGYWAKAYRTAPPYVARHLPWYVDSGNPDAEEQYYRLHSHSTTYWTIRS